MSGGSKIEMKIHKFRDVQGSELDCDEEMGLRSHKLQDNLFTAKSVFSQACGAHLARLHKRANGWCCQINGPVSDYLQIDLSAIKFLRGVALQSNGLFVGWHAVLSFKIQYSVDGATWHWYSENSTVFEFKGNKTVCL